MTRVVVHDVEQVEMRYSDVSWTCSHSSELGLTLVGVHFAVFFFFLRCCQTWLFHEVLKVSERWPRVEVRGLSFGRTP